MSSMNILFTLIGLSTVFFSCVKQKSSQAKSAGDSKDLLIVAMGGYMSCLSRDPKDLKFNERIQDLKSSSEALGFKVTTMVSCYDARNDLPIKPATAKLTEQLVTESKTTYTKPVIDKDDTSHRYNQLFYSIDGVLVKDHPKTEDKATDPGINRSEFLKDVWQKISEHENGKVIVLGHSHGGWTAMELYDHNPNISSKKVDLLVTIDPISRVMCTPSYWLNAPKPTSPKELNECQKFPSDKVSKVPMIKTQTVSWLNYYQDKTPSLHSSAEPSIEEAQDSGDTELYKNILGAKDHVEVAGDTNDWGHSAILKDEAIWSSMRNAISNEIVGPLNPISSDLDLPNGPST